MADNAHTTSTTRKSSTLAAQLADEGIDLDSLYHPDHSWDFDHEAPLWSEILPGLYQGGTFDNDVLGKVRAGEDMIITPAEFNTVVTLYQFANPVDWFVRELRFGIFDSDVDHFPLEELFDLVKLAHADWKRGKRVLVRCQAGINRSGLVTALILIREGYSAAEAIKLQRGARSNWVLANRDFVDFLLGLNADDWRGDSYPAQNPSTTDNQLGE